MSLSASACSDVFRDIIKHPASSQWLRTEVTPELPICPTHNGNDWGPRRRSGCRATHCQTSPHSGVQHSCMLEERETPHLGKNNQTWRHEGRMTFQLSICRKALPSVMLGLVIAAAELGTVFVEGKGIRTNSPVLNSSGIHWPLQLFLLELHCPKLWVHAAISIN